MRRHWLLGLLMLGVLCVSCSAARGADFQAGLEAYQRGDYANAIKEWRPLADAGDAPAQYRLAGMYSGGQGLPQDIPEALKWYRLAAEQGLADAQYMLGVTYQMGGRGVPADYSEALKWYRMAAEKGFANAQ